MTLNEAITEALNRWPPYGTAWKDQARPDRFSWCHVGTATNMPPERVNVTVYGSGETFELAFEDATRQGR